MAIKNVGYAAAEPGAELKKWNYEIREPSKDEVILKVMYCGICYSDIHLAGGHWPGLKFPMVPGHEFVGVIDRIGAEVTNFKVGDRAAIGCLVGSCGDCKACARGEQNLCHNGHVHTYGMTYRGETTYGGYGRYVVCRSDFVLHLPEALPMDRAAPLLCAGITTYTPFKHNMIERGNLKIAVVGLGGLGHMALQFAKQMNTTNEVIVITRTKAKEELAKQLGATKMIVPTDTEELAKYKNYFDYMIDTTHANLDLKPLVDMLAPRGSYIVVGIKEMPAASTALLCMKAASIQGSVVGGIPETQEMLNFCAEKQVLPMVEHITEHQVNEAWDRVKKSDVMFRFVIDVEKTWDAETEN